MIDPHRLAPPRNPPGRSRLAYRVGVFDSFVDAMVDRLSSRLATAGPVGGEPRPDSPARARRIRLNLAEQDNWILALVKSWATVADVLGFYQERLVQEGYLRTAVEDLSVHALARAVAYRPRPGVAGSAYLAVSVTDVKGLPEQVQLAPGLVVRSVPPPGAQPQTFETLEALAARRDWNLVTPPATSREAPPVLLGGATRVSLRGTSTGLGAGQAILVSGAVNGRPVEVVRLIARVSIEPGEPPFTEVEWSRPLLPDSPHAEISSLRVYAFRQQAGLFGHNAPRWEGLSVEERQRIAPPWGGVLVGTDRGFRPQNRGLPASTEVRCLAVEGQGVLFAGTAGEGIYRSSDGGDTWEPARRGLAQLDVRALIADSRGVIYTGTSGGGVYRSTDGGEIWEPITGGGTTASGGLRRWLRRAPVTAGRLPASPVRALAVAGRPEPSTLFAGTDSGIYRSSDGGRTWQGSNRGLPGADAEGAAADLVVSALAVGSRPGLLYAATARGVFRSTDGGRRFRPANRGLPETDPFTGVSTTGVHALVAYRDPRSRGDRLVAATAAGLFRSADGGDRWRPAERGLGDPGGPPRVLALAVARDPVAVTTRLFAGTERGLWASSDHGESWEPVALGGTARVAALAVGLEGGPVVVAAPFGGFPDEWPRFRIEGGRIDLDGVVSGVAVGGLVALWPGEGSGRDVGVYRIERVATVQRRDFSLVATVTRVEVAPDELLPAFDLRQTRVLLRSEALPLRPRVVSALPVSLAALRSHLVALGEPARRVIVAGRTFGRTWRGSLPPLSASEAVERLLDEVGKDDEATATVRVWVSIPERASERPPDVAVTLPGGELVELLTGLLADRRLAEAFLGRAPIGGGDDLPPVGVGALEAIASRMQEARGRGVQITLELEVAPRPLGAVTTAGELARHLEGALEVAAANGSGRPEVVLPRGPGETEITLDPSTLRVYGNVVAAGEGATVAREVLGDGDATLANQSFELAQAPAFHRWEDEPLASAQVRVQGQRWREVPYLHAVGGESHVYRLDVDHAGRGRVIFGSGNEGARLPTGRGNVTATYRTGMTSRQVPEGGLSLLASRPLGLDAVTNPLPSVAGAAPEEPARIRRRAPGGVRTLGRIVSLGDYADFARELPGIEKAGAWALPMPGGRAVQVTVAAPEGEPLDAGGGLLAELARAFARRRGHAAAVYLGDHAAVRLVVTASLRVAPDRRFEDVEPLVERAVAERFGFARSRFGGSVVAAALVAAMQGVPGVVAVDLSLFTWAGADETMGGVPAEARHRTARMPSWDGAGGRAVPAELVYVGRLDLLPMEAV